MCAIELGFQYRDKFTTAEHKWQLHLQGRTRTALFKVFVVNPLQI